MLDNQDKIEIKEMIKEGTSDIRQNVSILQQDVTVLKDDVTILKEDVSVLKQDISILKLDVKDLKTGQSRIEVLMEDMVRKFDASHEILTDIRNDLSDFKQIKKTVEKNHGPRISTLELAFKKKMT